GKNSFKMKYAPHFGMFKNSAGEDLIDQLKFMTDQGFTALEDNGMMKRDIKTQEAIASQMAKTNMEMGVFVVEKGGNLANTLAAGTKENVDIFLDGCKRAVDVAKRVNAKWMTVVPGAVTEGMPPEQQTRHVIEALKRAAGVLEPHGLIMVCEPLNWRDHHGQFLRFTPQSIEIMKAVDSPSCMILQDLYHQQATEGNLIDHMNSAWDYIPYFQVGDNPGRREPGTGEINYANVFKHMHGRGYDGIVGMEHGKSMGGKEGEVALIEAYRNVDPT
ncbi:MAG TPA: xylose isomerase, partial [Phycisphaerales bacterium]|nr:xylose isomerase [Phycisphaerales bacterium]